MRVLLTSKDHPSYNQTGEIVRDLQSRGIEVRLDRTGEIVRVSEGCWKVLKIQEAS